MDPNATGYPALQQQQQHNAGYPVTTQSPHGQQFPFYPNAMPTSSSFPQSKTPVQQPHQQHSFGPVPLQSAGPGGAMMPSGFPQQPSGTLTCDLHCRFLVCLFFFCFSFSRRPAIHRPSSFFCVGCIVPLGLVRRSSCRSSTCTCYLKLVLF
jgi:hypothetical protein